MRRLFSLVLICSSIGLWMWPAVIGSTRPPAPKAHGFLDPGVFKYCGFVGGIQDFFTTATSKDGIHWANSGGSWTVITGNINAPTCLLINGRWYVHAAAANDYSPYRLWYVGLLDSDNKVTTVAIVDWFNQIPDLTECYSGEWFVDDIPHLTIPCKASGVWKTYETHPLDNSLGRWSDPVDMRVSGESMYDSSVIKLRESDYLLLVTELIPDGQRIEFQRSESLLGPYQPVTKGDWAGWSAMLGPHEGPWLFRTSDQRWRMTIEALNTHQLYFSDCVNPDPLSCEWSRPSPWVEDQLYRHGTVISPYH